MFFMFALAAKNIYRNFTQSILSIAGVCLSVAVILAIAIMNYSVQSSVEYTIAELGTGKTSIWVIERGEDTASIGTRQQGFDERTASTIAANSAVLSVHPSLKVYTTISSQGNGGINDFYLYGIRFSDDKTVRNYSISIGHYPGNGNEILLGETLAKTLRINVGSTVTIQSPQGPVQMLVTGLLPPDRGTGTMHNNLVAFAELGVVQTAFEYRQKITALDIVLHPNSNVKAVMDNITGLLPGHITAYTDPISDAANASAISGLRVTAFVFAAISIFIAAFLIYNTLSSSVEQSRREIGLLRLIGMTNRQIRDYFLYQSVFYAVIGSAAGVLLGCFMGFCLLGLMNGLLTYSSFFFELPSPVMVLTSMGLGILFTLAVGIIPAVGASKTTPLEVFRSYIQESDYKRALGKKQITGFLLIATGIILSNLPVGSKMFAYIKVMSPVLIFIGIVLLLEYFLPPVLKGLSFVFSKYFGLPGQLAAQSLTMHLKRTSVTIGAIIVAVGIFLGLFGAIFSVKKTIGNWFSNTNWADVLIFSTSGAEIDGTIIERIDQQEYIKSVNPMYYCFVSYDDGNLSDDGFLFQGFEPSSFQAFTGLQTKEGNTADAIALLENGNNILINENLSNMIGLYTGDTLTIKTPKGYAAFIIAGTVEDYSDFMHRMGKVVYVSLENLSRYWDVQGYTIIQCRVADGFIQSFVKDQILRDLAGDYNIKVLTHDEERNEVGSSIDNIMSIFYAVNVIIFIIVFMGIFNTVLINVLYQIREMAVLRILGCFSKQIRLFILCQAIAMSLFAYIPAAFIGLWFAEVLSTGASAVYGVVIHFYPPAALTAVFFLTTIFVSALAVLYPQRVALRWSITKILQEAAE